jgi:hypothetical protein
LIPNGIPAALLGHPGYLFDATENTLQFQQKLSWYFDKHVLKVGTEFMTADHRTAGRRQSEWQLSGAAHTGAATRCAAKGPRGRT